MAIIGFAVSLTAICILSKLRNMNVKKNLLMSIILSAILIAASRVFYVFHEPGHFKDISKVFSITSTGFAVYGGIIVMIVLSPAIAKLLKNNFMDYWDTAVSPMALGLAIGRLGCFMAGCCYGKVTDSPLGVVFPYMSQSHKYQILTGQSNIFEKPLPVYPTQLFEMAALLIIAAISLTILLKRSDLKGFPSVISIMLYSAYRFGALEIRANPGGHLSQYIYPVIYTTIIGSSLVWLFRNRKTFLTRREKI